MKRLLFLPILVLALASSGCALFDRCDNRDERDDALPPRPKDKNRPADRDDDPDRPRIGNLEWIGPSREAPPIYPSVPNLTPRETIPPRAEDPSWRNR
jgi:hypothetical protein